MQTSQREILKSLLPAIVFMVIYKVYSFKMALVVGFILGAVIYISAYRKNKRLNGMDKLGLFGLTVQSLLAALATNPKVYFVYPLIQNTVFAVIFFGSLFTKNCLVAIFAKDYNGGEEDLELLMPTYRKITLVWAVFFLLKALIKAIGMLNWSFEILYAVNWMLGTPLSVFLLWFSFAYPNRVYGKYRLECNGRNE